MLSYDTHKPSYMKYNDINRFLSYSQMNWFWNLYLGDELMVNACKILYTVCPSITPPAIIMNYPRTILIQAKYDILLDEGVDFYNSLSEYNVTTDIQIHNDSIHGFFGHNNMSNAYKLYSSFIKNNFELMMLDD